MLKSDKNGIVKVTGIFYALLFGLSLLWIWLSNNSVSFLFDHNLLRNLLITVSIAIATVGLSAYLARSFQWARRLEAEFYKLFSDLTKNDLFLLAFFSGIGEEFFFRGAMQPAFGYVITSLLFGSIHFIPKK
ncbi:MAG TPA: CPBP family intramembrane glutamic endopeptidase, partial [Thermodesulfovibrionia bacterium]|nr:CPBP family intramembrane glutamic endopeptidase [Thermodesulfovibrionia bacterium]